MPTLSVCRGCCCGSDTKRSDPAGQLQQLRDLTRGTARVRTTDCLGPCAQADVIAIVPSPAGRAAGGRPVWLSFMDNDDALDDLADWMARGGPGLATPSELLSLHISPAPART
jgi:hypothetical protein